MFTKELVDFLNQAGDSRPAKWLASDPSIHHFITCPRVSIRPGLFLDARRVSVSEHQYGRFITIYKRNGCCCYILQLLSEVILVEDVESLIRYIEEQGGECHVEQSYLMIDLPLGYELDFESDHLARILRRAKPASAVKVTKC